MTLPRRTIGDLQEVVLDTPFGAPSDAYLVGTLEGVRCAFLPRHGRGHRYLPAEVNYRANIWGFKKLGVRHLLSVSAVGSLAEDIAPGRKADPDPWPGQTAAPDTGPQPAGAEQALHS